MSIFVFDQFLPCYYKLDFKKSFVFVSIFQDESDARRESLIKGLCIYVYEYPDVLVQEYTVSVLWMDFGFHTILNLFIWLILCVRKKFGPPSNIAKVISVLTQKTERKTLQICDSGKKIIIFFWNRTESYPKGRIVTVIQH